jgi:hypothetical protein
MLTFKEKMKQIIKWMTIIGFAAVMVGCASGVKRSGEPEATNLTNTKVIQVQVILTDEAKKLVLENQDFSVNNLKSTIENQLKVLELLDTNAGQIMEVSIKSFRARSAFSAIAFGFMAGNDNIVGVMSIKDATGKTLKTAEISASYALGGIGGGPTSTRMGWLYGEFAKLSIQELAGSKVK